MIITGFLQARNEIKSGHLQRYLKWNIELLDNLVAIDDGSQDSTFDTLSTKATICIRNEHSNFLNEIGNKSKILRVAKQKIPETDWFLWLDADEVLYLDRGELESVILLADKQGYDAIDFALINLWRSESFYRVDSRFNDLRNVRLWKNKPNLEFKAKFGLHHSLHPSGIDKVYIQNRFKVMHYGFVREELILQKFTYGNRLLQRGENFWRLLNENELELRSIEEQLFHVGSRFPIHQQPCIKVKPVGRAIEDWYLEAKEAGFKWLDRSNCPDFQFVLPPINSFYVMTILLADLVEVMRGNDPGNFGIIATKDASVNERILKLGLPIIKAPQSGKKTLNLVFNKKPVKFFRFMQQSKIAGLTMNFSNYSYFKLEDVPIEFLAIDSKPLIKIENREEKNEGEVCSILVLKRATLYPFIPFVFYKECAEIHTHKILAPRQASSQVYLLPKFQLDEFVGIIQSELFQSFCNLNQNFDYFDLCRKISPKWLKNLFRHLK